MINKNIYFNIIKKLKYNNTSMNEINLEAQIKKYKSELSEQELIVLNIAIEHLGSSFDISKSIGFMEWKKENLNKLNNIKNKN